MKETPDFVELYGASLGFSIRPRTVLVEGTTDVDLFKLAARLEREKTGVELLGDELAIVAAGERDRGGTHGVIRELVSLRGMARTCLLPNGRPRYRFIGLFDNDSAGKQAVKLARQVDSSILEYKDVFRIWPLMPFPGNMDPVIVKNCFERVNHNYNTLDWELEDILSGEFVEDFLSENPTAVAHAKTIAGKTHRDLTRDGKARLHRFVALHAVYDDLVGVVHTLKAIRFYLNILSP